MKWQKPIIKDLFEVTFGCKVCYKGMSNQEFTCNNGNKDNIACNNGNKNRG